MRQHDSNHPALRTLDPLVGRWVQWVPDDGVPGGRIGPFPTSYAWTPDGGFLVQRTELAPDAALPEPWREHHPFPTVAYIGYDDRDARFTMLYADGRGVSRVYGLSLIDGELRTWRAAPGFHQRSCVRFDARGETLSGVCEMSKDGEAWHEDFKVVYERVSR
ncbi:hypothetical protein G3I40_02590 [Streptomyces sp. SID14478]|uniref:hypothetical protein n=1 Tax=Streptomyces sp. SID14478 TaxID=2706073 RepID=UPI0013DC4090|nr:hypothetical protein [Streptomyces sp. SID14478]NEB74132.1 hypothetical protein [Streptomyces sp. SID14478]